jgi:hypothetical protein
MNQVAETPQIALAFPELRCTFGGRSIIPDASVFLWERIPFDAGRLEKISIKSVKSQIYTLVRKNETIF